VNQGWERFFTGVASPGGRIAVLVVILVIGIVALAIHIPFAEHVVLATLAVLLVALK
jgi:hypothetical protein